ncbi:error-prone DNA polymerase [bacterium]|nr:error-prone DNA polymerase [bacterium]
MAFSVNSWIEWICHTNFSFLLGASHPHELVSRAVQFGYRGLGICDYDGVYGIARAYRELKELKEFKEKDSALSLKLLYGAEIHLERDHDLPVYVQNTIILYARTHKGYFNLCRLLTYSHRDGKEKANIPLDYLLSAVVDDLVAIQPMRGLIRRKEGDNTQYLQNHFGQLKDHFGSNLYLAVSRHLSKAEDKWIQPTQKLANTLDLRTLVAQDVFFATARDKDISDLLHGIRHNKTLDEIPEQFFVNSKRCLHSFSSLQKIYSAIPGIKEMCNNSLELGETFNFDLNELTYHYPKEMIPEGFAPQQYLEHLVWESAHKQFGKSIPGKIVNLLQHELSLVNTLNFADYFLTVWDIVRWARSQDILCQGRGSAANSAICYILGITAINPDKFDLLFERFISVERGDPPDIDVDFENGRREEVIQYIYNRYGREKAAMICNVITFKSRGAMRFTGKALGVPTQVIDRASKLRGSFNFRGVSITDTILGVREEFESEAQAPVLSDHTWRLWADLSERILYFPKYLGIHSGGFMLAEKDIDWLVPQEPATMDGRTVIQWCKEDIEALGFFKIDILALGMLTAIRKCLELLKTHYDFPLTLDTIPQDDEETYAMIRRAETTGVFQIESTAQKSSLPSLQPMNFYDLVVQVAIIRPGPILAGVKHPYLRRRNGLEPVTYAHPKLEPILKRTYGTIIFQEQLMRVAMAIGNFTPGEANEIRKNIGSFSSNGKIGKWVGKLTQGMVDNGISEEFIREVIQQIKGFSSYGFPESHAASFALLAYDSSYLKCHYPGAFFTALLSSQPMGFYQPDTLIKTARLCGVTILPVCVLQSEWDTILEPVRSEKTPPEYAMRLGFRLIAGISESGIKRMLERRNRSGKWRSISAFIDDTSLSRTDLTTLAAANAFRVFGVDRKTAIWLAEASPFPKEEFLPGYPEPFTPVVKEEEEPVAFPIENEIEAVESDYRATGTSLGRHLTQLIREQAWVYQIPVEEIVTSNRLLENQPGRFIAVFGMIQVRQSPGTARKMLFVTLEDEYGTIPIVIRPRIYAQYNHLIEGQAFLCVLGKLQVDNNAVSLLVSQVFSPLLKKADVIQVEKKIRYQQITSGDHRKIRNYM